MQLPTEEEIIQYAKQNPNQFFVGGFITGAQWMKEIAEIFISDIAEIQYKEKTTFDKEK